MKIKSLRLKNFRCHRDTVLALDKLNVIIGRNGAGKTSIKDAFEYALTGINRLTDGRGAGAEVMINWEAKKAEITLDLENIGIVTRGIPNSLQVADWEGNKSAQEEALLNKLGVDKRTIRAILNSTSYLRMDSEDQKGLLFDLVGMRFDKEKIIRAFLKWNQGEIYTAVAILDKITPNDIKGGSELFNDIYQDVYQLRRDEKKKLKEAENRLDKNLKPPPLPDNISLDDKERIEIQLADLSRERDQLIKNLGKIESELTRRNELSEQIISLEGEIGEVKKEIKAYEAIPDKLSELEEEKKKIVAQFNTVEDELKKVLSEYNELRLINQGKSKAVSALQEHESACPLAPDYVNCPLTEEDISELIKRLDEEVENSRELKLRNTINELEDKNEDLEMKLNEVISRIDKFKEEIKDQEERERKLKGLKKEVLEAKEKFEELAKLDDSSELKKRVSSLNERLERGKTLLKTIEKIEESDRQIEEYTSEKKELEERVAALELLVRAFKPSGIKNNLLKTLKNRVEAEANQVLKNLTAGLYQVSFQIEGDNFLLVKKKDWPDWAPARVLSTSEELRVGIIIQHVLNQLTGLYFMLIDEADTLEPANRELLINTVLKLRDKYDQIFILSTVGEREPVNPAIPGLRVWWLEDGICSEI